MIKLHRLAIYNSMTRGLLMRDPINYHQNIHGLKSKINEFILTLTEIVWGGTRDTGRNEIRKGLQQIKNFVENHKQTNVTVISVPHRHDLESKSWVNDAVKEFNRKLKKTLKAS